MPTWKICSSSVTNRGYHSLHFRRVIPYKESLKVWSIIMFLMLIKPWESQDIVWLNQLTCFHKNTDEWMMPHVETSHEHFMKLGNLRFLDWNRVFVTILLLYYSLFFTFPPFSWLCYWSFITYCICFFFFIFISLFALIKLLKPTHIVWKFALIYTSKFYKKKIVKKHIWCIH